MKTNNRVLVIGAGLAGSDAAFYLAENGVEVVLAECKKLNKGPAQTLATFGELVCTNSLKSMDPNSGHGLLKYEMEKLNSLVLQVGKKHAVPAGSALAVDRVAFSKEISVVLETHPNITVLNTDVTDPIMLAREHDCSFSILATGPLTTDNLSKWIKDVLTGEDLHFYDAIAPIVDADSLDLEKLYFKDRYEDVEEEKIPDYLNAPLSKEEYESFVDELIKAKKVPAASFEDANYFESCLPIDLMAERGSETLRFSCMKPVGLEESNGKRPYAVVQLRRENLAGEAYNLVGFQNRLTYSEQVRVFRQIPGFSEASFPHLGSVHRNTFLNARKILNADMSSKEFPRLHFAGQITGVEGYTESAAMGLYVANQILRKIQGKSSRTWPVDTALGALVNYIMTNPKPRPSNINFGLLPPVKLERDQRRDRKNRKKYKKEIAATRARKSFDEFFGSDEK